MSSTFCHGSFTCPLIFGVQFCSGLNEDSGSEQHDLLLFGSIQEGILQALH